MFGFSKKKSVTGQAVRGGWRTILEPFSGAWQRNVEWSRDSVLAFHAVFACTTLIASDISKLAVHMIREDADGIWNKADFDERYKAITKPNGYQNRIQFYEQWLNSKLTRGNTYVWKERNGNGRIIALHILQPDMVLPLVTDSGDVYYQLGQDNLAGVRQGGITVPGSEIIHDRFNCLYHPLVGLPPLYACGLPAHQGLKMQEHSARFFGNMARPAGILIAPGAIGEDQARQIKEAWEENYAGKGVGRTAVLGDDMKYQALGMTAEQSQMVEQLRITAEVVCSTYHVPAYKVIGNAPSYNNIEALEQQYYSQCLQRHIEDIELCLDEGFEMPGMVGIEFDLSGLLRMDTKTQIETLAAGVKSALISPNEGRKLINRGPVAGGNSPMMQQQNYSLEALAKRDAKKDPFTNSQQGAENEPATPPVDEEKSMMHLALLLKKELSGGAYVN